MFEVVALSGGFAAKRLWSTGLGLSSQALLLACAALAPLVSPPGLPRAQAMMAWLLPAVPPPPPPVGNAGKARSARPPVERLQPTDRQLIAPATVPDKVAAIVDEPVETPGYGVPGGVGSGERNGVPGAMLNGILEDVPAVPAVERAPAPVVAPPSVAPKQVPVGGRVSMARLIRRVEPLYPPLARQMRVSGTVELIGIIAVDGRIRELKLRSGNPLLAPAALDAVRRWVYEPTLLNGEPVELIATISVIFRLN